MELKWAILSVISFTCKSYVKPLPNAHFYTRLIGFLKIEIMMLGGFIHKNDETNDRERELNHF